MDGILELLTKRATSQARNTFAVHAPKKLLDHPELAASDDLIDQLKDSIFVVRFQDGTAKMLGLVELKSSMTKSLALMRAVGPEPGTRVEVSVRLSEHEIMQREMVKALLSTIHWADTAS
jgi:hypothetical protein